MMTNNQPDQPAALPSIDEILQHYRNFWTNADGTQLNTEEAKQLLETYIQRQVIEARIDELQHVKSTVETSYLGSSQLFNRIKQLQTEQEGK